MNTDELLNKVLGKVMEYVSNELNEPDEIIREERMNGVVLVDRKYIFGEYRIHWAYHEAGSSDDSANDEFLYIYKGDDTVGIWASVDYMPDWDEFNEKLMLELLIRIWED